MRNGRYEAGHASILRFSHPLLSEPTVAVRTAGAEFYRHIYRELNEAADAQAASRIDFLDIHVLEWPRWLRASCDGSRRKGLVGCGWVLEGSEGAASHPEEWRLLAQASWKLPNRLNVLEAEMCALQSATRFLLAVLVRRQCPRSAAVATFVRPQLWQIRLKHPDKFT